MKAPRTKIHLRFWQKTYLLTLAFFLIALFGGFGLVGWQNQQQSLEDLSQSVKAEQLLVAQNLSRDLAAIDSDFAVRSSSLARSYGEYYAQSDILIEITKDNDTLFSNLLDFPDEPQNMNVVPGHQSWMTISTEKGTFLIAKGTLFDSFSKYQLTWARPMDNLVTSWEQMRHTLIITGIIVSLVLAGGLFFILRSLSKPLERLASIADEFAAGNFAIRASEKGVDEVGTLATSLNDMADAAVSNINEIRQIADKNERMAADLSHEVRTPLTAIQGYAEYLRLSDPSDEERDSALDYIITESERLHKVSQRMLKLSTLNHIESDLTELDLIEPIRRALRSVKTRAEKSDVKLTTRFSSDLKTKGDEVLLESLMTNLIDNAIAACSEKGLVKIEAVAETSKIYVIVSDNGCGISQKELPRLGEPFYRPDKARSREYGGAGLGIALCHRIIDLHEAELKYQSTPEIGTVVTIEFTAL